MGVVKLLKHKENERTRLLMRQEKTLKVRANHIGESAALAAISCNQQVGTLPVAGATSPLSGLSTVMRKALCVSCEQLLGRLKVSAAPGKLPKVRADKGE